MHDCRVHHAEETSTGAQRRRVRRLRPLAHAAAAAAKLRRLYGLRMTWPVCGRPAGFLQRIKGGLQRCAGSSKDDQGGRRRRVRGVGSVAPLALDAVAYRTLVESDARIEAKFPGGREVFRRGQSRNFARGRAHRETGGRPRGAQPRDGTWPTCSRSAGAARRRRWQIARCARAGALCRRRAAGAPAPRRHHGRN